MTGYLREPEKTADTLIDGWIHTGDKGEIDEDGFLKITGRVKEIFKTTRGKYVAPVPIEGQFVSNTQLDQVCLMGDGLSQTALLVQLSAQVRPGDTTVVEEQLRLQVQSVNAGLDSHARIACVLIVKDEWSCANGLVTHTLKIKRSAIEKRYRSQVEYAFSIRLGLVHPMTCPKCGGTGKTEGGGDE